MRARTVRTVGTEELELEPQLEPRKQLVEQRAQQQQILGEAEVALVLLPQKADDDSAADDDADAGQEEEEQQLPRYPRKPKMLLLPLLV